MSTSGTVSQTRFTTRKVIDRAYNRCKIPPEFIGAERIATALDCLYMILSAVANKGIPLWAIQPEILPLQGGKQSVSCPLGTVDVLNCNLRKLQRTTGTNSTSASEYITTLEDATRITSFGVKPGSSGVWSFEIQGSNDNFVVDIETLYIAIDETMTEGVWSWFDSENIMDFESYRVLAIPPTTQDVVDFFLGNSPTEIPLALINRDDYANLPDKTFLGRPTQFWYDKQRVNPIITLWPAPGLEYELYQLVLYVKRHIQDVGTLAQELEIPQTWYLAIVNRLAYELALEDKEVPAELVPLLKEVSDETWKDAWDGQSDAAPVKLVPNIGPYTR